MKNAICMILFGKELYLLGCIVAGYVHKQFIKKNNYMNNNFR